MKFNDTFYKILESITTASAGVAGNTTSNTDSYAQGDARIPFKVVKKVIKRTQVDGIMPSKVKPKRPQSKI